MSTSTNYTMSDIMLEERDMALRRMERRTYSQFVLADYLILKSYEYIANRIHAVFPDVRIRCGKREVPTPVFNNPYHLDECQLGYLVEQVEEQVKPTSKRTKARIQRDLESLTGRDGTEKQKDLDYVKKIFESVITYLLKRYSEEFKKTTSFTQKESLKPLVEERLKDEFGTEWDKIQKSDPKKGKKGEDTVSLFERVLEETLNKGIGLPDTSTGISVNTYAICCSLTERISDAEPLVIPTIDELFTDVFDVLGIVDVFKFYMIFLTVQRLLSYGLVNTQRVYDFRVEQDIPALQRSSNLYGTPDNPNEEGSDWVVESRTVKILDELVAANGGLTIAEPIEDVLIELAFHMGHLSKSKSEIIESESEGDIHQAIKERNLLKVLFPTLEIHPNEDNEYHKLSSIIDNSGLGPVIDKIDRYLPDSILHIKNAGILNDLINVWGALFKEDKPDTLDQLIAILPTISESFRMSTTTSETQIDFRNGALTLMEDFLEDALVPTRLSELEYLLNYQFPNAYVYYFRSLMVLVDKEKGIEPWDTAYKSPWVPWDHPLDHPDPGRIKFLKLIHVALSDPDDQDLGDIFRYALFVLSLKQRKDYFEGVDPTGKVVPSAMFPGSLERLNAQVVKGGRLIERNFEREQKNKHILMTRLGRAGGVETALKNAKLRWYP